MKKKLLILFIVILMVMINISVYAYDGIDVNITIGNTAATQTTVTITSRMLGIFQTIGSVISVVALIIIGIRYMTSSVEKKAELKGILGYYVIGAVLVFSTSNVLGIAYDVITDMDGHEWDAGVVTKAATCYERGVLTYTCSICGKTKTEQVIKNINNHSWNGGTVTQPATCIAKGWTKYTCVGCGTEDLREDIEIDAINHLNIKKDTTLSSSSTCKAKGVTVIKCFDCGTETSRTELPLEEHNETLDTENSKESTCAKEGVIIKKCSSCGDVISTTPVPKKDKHSWGDWVTTTAAKCSETGTKRRTCTLCKNATETGKIPATGLHSWGEWVTTKVAKCSEKGTKSRTCTVCKNATETDDIDAIGTHSWNNPGSIIQKANCARNEITLYTCNTCGDQKTEITKEATGAHDMFRLVLIGPEDRQVGMGHFHLVKWGCTNVGCTYTELKKELTACRMCSGSSLFVHGDLECPKCGLTNEESCYWCYMGNWNVI